MTRVDGPLRAADGAAVVDTTGLTDRRGRRADRRAAAVTKVDDVPRRARAGQPCRLLRRPRRSSPGSPGCGRAWASRGASTSRRTGAFVLAPVHRSNMDTPIVVVPHAPPAAVHGQGLAVEAPAGGVAPVGARRVPGVAGHRRPRGAAALHRRARGRRAARAVPRGRAQVRPDRAAAVRRRRLRRAEGRRADRAGRHRRLRAGDAEGRAVHPPAQGARDHRPADHGRRRRSTGHACRGRVVRERHRRAARRRCSGCSTRPKRASTADGERGSAGRGRPSGRRRATAGRRRRTARGPSASTAAGRRRRRWRCRAGSR